MAKWELLDDASRSIAGKPWSLYYREMQAGTKEFDDFLQDPLRMLIGKLSGVNITWKVQTSMIGQEISHAGDTVFTLAMVDPYHKTVFLTLYKQPRD